MINFIKNLFKFECKKERVGETVYTLLSESRDTHSIEEWLKESNGIRNLPLTNEAKTELRNLWISMMLDRFAGTWEIYQSEKERLLESCGNE